jgi:hypothetical protein
MNENTKTFEVSVIVFREDSDFTALALEMDIRGYGTTPQAAIDDVTAMLAAQISFAVQIGNPEGVWHPAAEKFWRMFEEARRKRFVAEVSGVELDTDQIARMVPLSLLALKHKEEWTATGA